MKLLQVTEELRRVNWQKLLKFQLLFADLMIILQSSFVLNRHTLSI